MSDVAGQVIAMYLDFLEERGHAANEILADLAADPEMARELDREKLRSPRHRVAWGTHVAFCARIERFFDAALLDAYGRRLAEDGRIWTGVHTGLARLLSDARLVDNARQLYDVLARWNGPRMFANLRYSMDVGAEPRELRIVIEIRPEDAPCPILMAVTKALYTKAPRWIGLPDARVTAHIEERRGVFVVTLPPVRRFWQRTWRRVVALLSTRKMLDLLETQDIELRDAFIRLSVAHRDLERMVEARTSELAQANVQLVQRLDILRELEQIAHVGSFEWESATDRLQWSDEAFRIFGASPSEGGPDLQTVLACIDPEDRERMRSRLREAMRVGERSFDLEYRIRIPTGEERIVRARGAIVRTPGTETWRIIGTIQDVTMQRRYETSLIQAKDAADMANRMKTAFLANISHEIRTPMTAVLGFAELLGDAALTPVKRQTYVETITRNGRHLINIIDDVLDLSRIESGHLVIKTAPFAPATEIAQAVEWLRGQAVAKGLALTLRFEEPWPPEIVSDATRLRQIVLNILGNAIKFTDRGEVKVVCRERAGTLAIEVSDTGRGIEPRLQEALFQPFVRGSGAHGEQLPAGTGLGLALARSLARALGGDVLLRSGGGERGSTFFITLKTRHDARADAIPAAPVGALVAAASLQASLAPGLRILVAEDNPDIQGMVKRALENYGATVDVVGDGAACLERVSTATYDAIIMDLQMPVLDGYAATAQLRKNGFARPILALTAFAMSNEREKCVAAGCTDFLAKPVETHVLVRAVAKWTSGRA
jgi:PAS domain S-box-containing protein